MQIQFKNIAKYNAANTFLISNDYRYTPYRDTLQMRFFYPMPFATALSSMAEMGIVASDYDLQETENFLPKLANSWSAA